MEIVVRPIELEDYQDIKNYLFIQSDAEEIKKYIAKDLQQMAEGKVMRCVAVTERKVVGQADFRKYKSPIKSHLIEVTGMVVNGEYQGKGISSKLMEYGLNWAKKQGIEKATLGVREGTKAEKVYRHQGFQVYGKLDEGMREPWGDKNTYNEILMYKQIT